MSKFKLKDEVFAISYGYKHPVIIKSFIVDIKLEPFHTFEKTNQTIYCNQYKLYNEIIPFFEDELFKTHEETHQRLMEIYCGGL